MSATTEGLEPTNDELKGLVKWMGDVFLFTSKTLDDTRASLAAMTDAHERMHEERDSLFDEVETLQRRLDECIAANRRIWEADQAELTQLRAQLEAVKLKLERTAAELRAYLAVGGAAVRPAVTLRKNEADGDWDVHICDTLVAWHADRRAARGMQCCLQEWVDLTWPTAPATPSAASPGSVPDVVAIAKHTIESAPDGRVSVGALVDQLGHGYQAGFDAGCAGERRAIYDMALAWARANLERFSEQALAVERIAENVRMRDPVAQRLRDSDLRRQPGG
jgi:hypothetical protein